MEARRGMCGRGRPGIKTILPCQNAPPVARPSTYLQKFCLNAVSISGRSGEICSVPFSHFVGFEAKFLTFKRELRT